MNCTDNNKLKRLNKGLLKLREIVALTMLMLMIMIALLPSEVANASISMVTHQNNSEAVYIFLETLWNNSTEEAITRTSGYEKEEEYNIAKENFDEYDKVVRRSNFTLSEVMPSLGNRKLDSGLKRFYIDFENEIYNDAKNRFIYEALSGYLEYYLAGFEEEYAKTGLGQAELAKKSMEIKAFFGMTSSESLSEAKTTVGEFEKLVEKDRKSQLLYEKAFSSAYPTVELSDSGSICGEVLASNDIFRSFSENEVTKLFLENDISYIQMEQTLKTYKSHFEEFGKYMKLNDDYKKEADREQADIFYMEYELTAKKEMIGTTVRSLISQYDSLEKEILLAKDKVSTSQKSLELEQKKYSFGFSTKLLILDKETELRKNEYSLEILRAQKLKLEFMLEKGILL